MTGIQEARLNVAFRSHVEYGESDRRRNLLNWLAVAGHIHAGGRR
jgi:hypothetical protein